MFFQIEDGSGSGRKLKINSKNRAETQSVSRNEEENASLEGNSYLCGTGPINLTSGNESAVFYLKNNENSDLIIKNFTFTSSAITGAANGVFLLKLYKNPDGISSGTDIPPANTNFGSSKTLVADVQFGAEAATVTNGILGGSTYMPQQTLTQAPLSWIVPKGSSFAITVEPEDGNTDTNINLFLDAYLNNEE